MGTGLGWDGKRLVVRSTGDLLTATFLYIECLTQSPVKRRWAILDVLKSVPTQFFFSSFFFFYLLYD